MTPKEKAIELITRFQHPLSQESDTDCLHIEVAKEFALLSVDELIKYHDDLMDVVRYELPSHIVAILPYKYWEEVKKEIELL
jgi:hypothetical protein